MEHGAGGHGARGLSLAIRRSTPQGAPVWTRLLEWGLVALILATLIGVFTRQTREMQGQAELAAVRATLGSLRTALVIDHLQRAATGTRGNALTPRNPFKLLKQRPLNYWEVLTAHGQSKAPPGHWFFDAACDCVGYIPSDPRWLDHFNDGDIVWFKLSDQERAAPMDLVPKATYTWQKLLLK